ncbi:hypothetical protein ABIB85_007410 [Bradyrhizobium sp. JR1.5]
MTISTMAQELFAVLSMLDGKVIGACMARHQHREFLRFPS